MTLSPTSLFEGQRGDRMLAKRGRGGKGRKVVYTLQREASLGELVGMSVSHPCALPLAIPLPLSS